MAPVTYLDEYQACWREVMSLCKGCRHVWRGLARADTPSRDIRCPECSHVGARVLSAGPLQHLPRSMRGKVGL